MLDSAELHQDSTSLPLTVNISNPNYDPHKYSYYVPECKNCGQKTCKNCPMPVTNSKNLGDLLELIVMQDKFKENANLYLTKEALKELVDGKENTAGEEIPLYRSNNKFITSLQDSSDEDMYGSGKQQDISASDNNNAGRHYTF